MEYRGYFSFGILLILASMFFVLPAHAQTFDPDQYGNVHGFLWSDTIGYVSMNCNNDWDGNGRVEQSENLGSCAWGNYGVVINDDYSLTGRAWAPNIGLICFGSSCEGVLPSGGLPQASFDSNSPHQLSGYARAIGVPNGGWIKLSGIASTGRTIAIAAKFKETVDPGVWAGFGWNQDVGGGGIGWIDFGGVNTTFSGAGWDAVIMPQGIYEPKCVVAGVTVNCDDTSKPLLGTHQYQFVVTLKNVHAPSGTTITCRIDLPNATTKNLTVTTSQVRYDVLGFPYTISAADNSVINGPNYEHKPWILKSCVAEGMLAKDYNLPIFVHGNTWTEVSRINQDMRRAKDCWDNQYGRYFTNSTRCNFEGDYVFARSMARGMPVGLDCANCTDRACKGIAYQCIKSCAVTNNQKPCKEVSMP